ncbi:GTPase ObgE [bacterium]|nr:GTPase ObgE [bacterium]
MVDFIDEVSFRVCGGRGGDGCVSFRREKFVPKGGPDGGDGGDGGSVILRANSNLSTLLDLRHRKKYQAGNGKSGMGKCRDGKRGENIVILVPPGTLICDVDQNTLIEDLKVSGQECIVARGGKGGRGNAHFATSTCQVPDFAEKGSLPESRHLKLELKLLADVGLVGFPNAGKSTLLSKISSARPKIADYPFTTTTPHLGIVHTKNDITFVAADIPGIIKNGHMGKGLGDRFLRHAERCRVLVFLIEAHTGEIQSTYETLLNELQLYDDSFLVKPRIIALTKIDLLHDREKQRLPTFLYKQSCYPVSAVTGEGVEPLLHAIVHVLFEAVT